MEAANAYPRYRAARMRWLPPVPEHWNEQRAKTFFREVDERSKTGQEELLSVSHLTGVTPRSHKNVTMFKAASYVGSKLCRPGDIVINTLWAWMAALGASKHVGIVSPAYGVYRPHKADSFNPAYLDYLLRTRAYVAEYIGRSTGIRSSRLRLYPNQFLDIALLQPPRPEQDQIVAYLRAQDAHIARFIKAKRDLIGLLNEQKLRIIDHAVTRGLDTSVALKPSGIEWLGDVPEHWKTIHIGSAVQIVNGYPFDSGLFDPEVGHPLVRIRDLMRTDTEVKFNGTEVAEAVIEAGDLLVGMDGDFNAARWRGGRALLNQRMCCLRPRKEITTEYLSLVIPKALKFINDLALSTTVKHLSSVDVKRLRFPIPDDTEQLQIVEWVATESAPLEEAIQRAEEEIKLIREYRDRQITDVVTGQVDVRGWVPGSDDVVTEEDLSALGGDEEIDTDGEENDGDD
ncbi:restriction endonuclease subunit S [Burkholderia ubonensis]|uniref:Restriction endonuclease subunit S n=2 Tax=Burkholderia ubonensis TaxID=101571 RepID=A0A118HR74_9BURK|nr:restriction endonuclease subunit S [Burkholderia ubonensis]KVG63528.1 restriction endonuclease subunit S [Burkholderia ubonensis]